MPHTAEKLLCPYCTSSKIRRLPKTHKESQSDLTWYRCLSCGQNWNREQHLPLPMRATDRHSPDAA